MKKKILVWCIVVAMTLSVAATAFAENGDGGTTDVTVKTDDRKQVSSEYASDVFSMLSTYKDDTMKSSYKNGYVPLVENNTAYIVLPLKFDRGKLQDGSGFQMWLDLGGQSDPFVVKNYEKSISLNESKDEQLKAELDKDHLIVRFNPRLSKQRTNGSYPVYINITYTKTSGEKTTERFLIYVTITDEVIPEPEPTDDPDGEDTGEEGDGGEEGIDGGDIGGGGGGTGEEESIPKPKVIMTEYNVTPDPVYAGDTFTVSATLSNTSDKTKVQNMTVTLDSEGDALMPEGNASTIYIAEIPAKGTTQFSFSMTVRADVEPGVQKVGISVDYEDSKTNDYNVADSISVQVRQHTRLEYDEPQFPTAMSIGESLQTSLNLYNMGKNTLYNVSAELDMEGVTPESSIFLGNMLSGDSKTADIYFAVGQSAENPELPVAPGLYEGNLIIKYEDEYGEAFDIKIPIESEITEQMIMDPNEMYPEDMSEEETGGGFPWWGWAVIGGGGAAVAGGVIAGRRKKKREQQLLEEMEDDESA